MRQTLVVAMIVSGVLGVAPSVFAQPPDGDHTDQGVRDHGAGEGRDGVGQGGEHRRIGPGPRSEEVERLRALKEQDPEAFRQAVEARKATLREKMAHLKETDPEAFERAKERLQEHHRRRLEHLKERDPERFQELIAQRKAKAEERLEHLKQENPEKYDALMQRRQEWRERHQDRREDRRDHREDVRDRREDVRDRREDFRERYEPAEDRGEDHGGQRLVPPRAYHGQQEHEDRGVRDYGRGEGRDGVGQGGEHRKIGPGKRGGPRQGGGRRGGR